MVSFRRTLSAALLLAVVAAVPAAAQGRGGVLAGTVRDASGAPLPHAQVALPALGRTVMADAQGRFTVRNIPPGRHRLHASLIGYAPVSREVHVGADRPSPDADVVLAWTPLALEGIQVTGTTAGKDPMAVTHSTTQLGGRALERSLSTTVAQTLASQPGIRVRYNGPAAAMPVMRGLTGDRVLVLQDGQRASDLAGSATDHAVTIDPLAAQRIEVVRGPATLLYGNNALGGVVNVISDDIPMHLPGRVERVVVAQTESALPGAGVSGKMTAPLGGAWAMTVRGGGRSGGDVRIGDDPVLGGRLVNTDAWHGNGSVGIARVGERVSGGVAVKGYRFGYGLPMPVDEAGIPLDTVRLAGQRWEAIGRAEVQTASTAFPSVRVDATAQDYAHDELDGRGGLRMAFGLRTATASVLARQGRLGPLSEGAWGVSGLVKRYESTGASALTPAADSRAWGVFGFQELGLGEGRPALQVGARFDQYAIESRDSQKFGAGVSRTFRAVSGSAGVRVPVSSAVSASVTASRSFRAPTVEELFSGALHAGTGSVEYGTPTLRAERGTGAEALLRVRSPRWSGQFVAYVNRISNYVHLQAQPDTLLDGHPVSVFRYVQHDATLRGVEASLEWAARNDLALGISGDALGASQADGTPLSYMPPPRVGGWARWDDGRWSLGAEAHHEVAQDRVGSADEARTPPHGTVRLDAGVRVTRGGAVHSISLRAENLSNELHREATSRIKEFAPNPGRNLALVYRVIF